MVPPKVEIQAEFHTGTIFIIESAGTFSEVLAIEDISSKPGRLGANSGAVLTAILVIVSTTGTTSMVAVHRADFRDRDNGIRRSAIEPVIGDMKAESHLGRRYLKRTAGDAANAILTAVGHNLRLGLAWLKILLRLILAALWRPLAIHSALKLAS
jgi:hypothetical protein